MAIKFFLSESKLTPIAGKYVACVETNMTVDLNFLAQLVSQSGLSASADEIKGILGRTCEIIEQQVTVGNLVQLGGIATLRPTIRGTFNSISDGYDPTVNSIEVAVAAGARLRQNVQKNAAVEKLPSVAPSPNLNEFVDIATGAVNTAIACGALGQINGSCLNFDAEQPDEGLFLFDNMDATPVKATVIQKASATQLVFMVPNVASPSAETGHFVVRRRNRSEGPLIEGRSVTMDLTPAAVTV